MLSGTYVLFTQCTATNGTDFYCNLPSTALKQYFGNPDIASKIVRCPEVCFGDLRYMISIMIVSLIGYDIDLFLICIREMYHAQRWHNDFLAPMTCCQNSNVFVNDFVKFIGSDNDEYIGKVVKIFRNEGLSLIGLIFLTLNYYMYT